MKARVATMNQARELIQIVMKYQYKNGGKGNQDYTQCVIVFQSQKEKRKANHKIPKNLKWIKLEPDQKLMQYFTNSKHSNYGSSS